MKIIKLFIGLILLLIVYTANAQTSERGFSFQGYATNSEGVSLTNEDIEVRFTVYPKTGVGYTYEEIQTKTTDINGVFHAVVGSEDANSFQRMNFTAKGTDFWMKVEFKKTADANYTQISDAKMMAVPYAKYAANGVPVGTIMPFAAEINKVPEGWLLCDGTEYNGTDAQYLQLYTIIQNTWGGTGTNFNVPELRGYFLRGYDAGQGNDPDAATRTALFTGGNTGDNVGSYQNSETQPHKHSFSGNTSDAGSHSHTFSGKGAWIWSAASEFFLKTESNFNPVTYYTEPAGAHSHTFSGTTVNSEIQDSRPKNVYVVYIIKY